MSESESTWTFRRAGNPGPTLRLIGWRWAVRDGVAEAIQRHARLPIERARALLEPLLGGGEAHLHFRDEAALADFLTTAEALDAEPLSSDAIAVGREQIRARLADAFAAPGLETPAARRERAVMLLAEHMDRLVGTSDLPGWSHADALSSDAVLAVDGAMALVRVELHERGVPLGVLTRWKALESEWEDFAAADATTSTAALRRRVEELRRLLSRAEAG